MCQDCLDRFVTLMLAQVAWLPFQLFNAWGARLKHPTAKQNQNV